MNSRAQPGWRVSGDDQAPITDEDRSRFVVLTIGLDVEATDVPALQAAVAALDGPPEDAIGGELLSIPAELIGRLFGQAFRPTQLLEQLPGVIVHSGWSATDIDRDWPPQSTPS